VAKVIGIDLGTTNSCVAIMDGKNDVSLRTPRARGRRPRSWHLPATGAPCRPASKAAGSYKPDQHDLCREAANRTPL
jgi:molecular chaperone DnaK (HSP70)